jgi:hypothetical protein
VGTPPQRKAWGLEIRKSVALRLDGLAINDRLLAVQIRVARTIEDRARHGRCELDASLPSLKLHLAAIAVVFDFVNPVLALWRLIDRERKEIKPRREDTRDMPPCSRRIGNWSQGIAVCYIFGTISLRTISAAFWWLCPVWFCSSSAV